MPERVIKDIITGPDDIPGATAKGVMEILVSNLREGVNPDGLSLIEILRLQEPAHAMVGSGYFEPGGGFEFIAELLPPSDVLELLHEARRDYLRETWMQGDKGLQAAVDLFQGIQGSALVRGLYDALPQTKPRFRDRLLGRIATATS